MLNTYKTYEYCNLHALTYLPIVYLYNIKNEKIIIIYKVCGVPKYIYLCIYIFVCMCINV